MTSEPQAARSLSILGVIDEIERARHDMPSANVRSPLASHFERVTRLARQFFGVESAAVALLDPELQALTTEGAKGTGLEDDALFRAALAAPGTFVVVDASRDLRFSGDARVSRVPGVRFYAAQPLEAPGGERIGALSIFDTHARILTSAEQTLLQDLALWVQNEMSVAQELDRATEIQRGLLPGRLLSLPGFDVAGMYVPARALGGDFYDWYPVGEGAAFTLADVMGKGIGAAIIAATVRAVLRSGSRQGEISAAVESAASTLEADLDHAGIFVTLFHARLNMDTGVVRYIDAGHGLTLVVFAAGGVERLATKSLPLGSGIDSRWSEHSVTLEPGDTLITFSDGLLDLYDGTLASLDNVERLVRESASAQEVADRLTALAGHSAPDDLTAIVLRRDV